MQKESKLVHVLSIGSDPALMKNRQLVLENNGHTVVGVTDEKMLIAACGSHSFDIAIISHKISPRMKQRVSTLVRDRCLNIKILEMCDSSDHALHDADSWMEHPDELQKLAERVNALAKVG